MGEALEEKTGGKTEITERDTNLVQIFRSVVLQMFCLTTWQFPEGFRAGVALACLRRSRWVVVVGMAKVLIKGKLTKPDK